MNPVEAFASAGEVFVALVRRTPPERLDDPALGSWDLRSLIGHTTRALTTVDSYLDRPAERAEVPTAEEYFERVLGGWPAQAAQIEQRGRDAGLALGDDPAAAVRAELERVSVRLAAVDDPVIETPAGGMRLSAYLPTRTFELVVHSLDIAAAAGHALDVDAALLAEATGLAARLAVRRGEGTAVLRALTGRRSLPPGFSVV